MKGRWIAVAIYRDAKYRGIYLALLTDPEGDNCFSIYQIGWIKKWKKVPFCKLKMSLNRKFFYNLQTFWEFFQVHFYDFVANSAWKQFSTDTSRNRQGKVSRFLGICLYDCFIYRSNFVFRKCLEARRHLSSGHKTVNGQGYSELREPVKTREKCCSPIW